MYVYNTQVEAAFGRENPALETTGQGRAAVSGAAEGWKTITRVVGYIISPSSPSLA